MIDTNICNAFHTAGCAPDAAERDRRPYPSAVAVDPNTHTVYVATPAGRDRIGVR